MVREIGRFVERRPRGRSARGYLPADGLAVDARTVVVVDGEVPGGLVVPDNEVAWLPTEPDGVVGRRRVRQKERQDRLALVRFDAGKPDRRRTEEQTLAAGMAMRPHHRMLDRLGYRRPIVCAVARVGAVHGAD